jgi:ABC-type glycerol-3-phosphate transport system substrate-binding protein
MRKWYAIILLIAISASGCSLFRGDEEEATVTPTPLFLTPISRPTVNPSPGATEAVTDTEPTTLNVWILNEFGPDSENPGNLILADQLSEFDNNHPEIVLNVDVKSSAGQGGTLNYLRTGRNVAPDILPDLIMLESDQLPVAAAEELIFPLDGLLQEEMIDDLFPAARSLVRAGESTYGYPMAMTNFQHAVFNTIVLSDTIPSTWDETLRLGDVSFVFPAAGQDGAELALLFYLASGGQLAGDANHPTLDVEPLTNALNQFARGRNVGMIAPSSLGLATLADVWSFYANSVSNMAQTEVSILLTERESGDESGFAMIPGIDQPLAPLVKGWAWAISTPDPVRQASTMQLMTWLTSAENMGEWSDVSKIVPSRRSALTVWNQDDDYVKFLQDQLEFARAYPGGANSAVMSALSEAVFNVMSMTKSPRTAAEEAAAALNQ